MMGVMNAKPASTTTLAVANQKGGVAKTTSVASIGAALAEMGQSVLLVDLDPQACLTFSLGIDPEDLEMSVHQVLTKGSDPTESIIETEDGVDLLPATIELARAEADLLTRTGREHVLRGVLEDLARGERHYDWVLLDCPPSLGVLTVVTGVAGSGKSSLVHGSIAGRDGVVVVDQGAIKGSRRSNPATYTGLLEPIRKAFAKANGVKPALFSSNSEGACSTCNGAGVIFTAPDPFSGSA